MQILRNFSRRSGMGLVFLTLLVAGTQCTTIESDCPPSDCGALSLLVLYSYYSDSHVFVAVGQNATLRTSFDGQTWTGQALATTTLQGVGSDEDYLYATGQNDTAFRSADGLTWTGLASLNTGVSNHYNSIVSANGILLAGGDGGEIRRSADGGQTWTNLTTQGNSATIEDLELGGGVVRGVNNDNKYMLFSSDLTSYSEIVPPSASFLNALTYHNGVWVVTGATSYVARTTDDGATWQNQTLSGGYTFEGAAYGNGRFVIGGHDGVNTGIYTSTDAGLTWVLSNPPFGRTRAVAYGNGVFVLAGDGGLIAYSATPEDSSSWRDVSLGADHSFNLTARSLTTLEGALGALDD